MGSKRVCPHTITLYLFTGEDEDGRAVYRSVLLQRVHVYQYQGVQGGSNSEDSVRVHIFDDTVEASGLWTVSQEGKDYLAIGDHPAVNGTLPAKQSHYRIVSIARRVMGNPRMWHWRLEAR